MRGLRTTDFDAIAAAAPLDAQASIVRDGDGDHWRARIPADVEHWSAPPLPEDRRPFDSEDLTGLVVGRLTAICYHRRHRRGGRWLVHCQCGDYEVRSKKALTGSVPAERSMCHACGFLDAMQRAPARDTAADRAADAALFDQLAAKAVRR